MQIEPLYPNSIGNLGLVNLQKIQLRQHSVIFHHLFENTVSRSRFSYFFPDKNIYTYTDVVTVREIIGGLTLLKLMDAVIKPQLEKKPSNPNPAANQSGVGKLGKWLFKDVRPMLSGPNKKNYAWCPLHGRKTDGVHSGMNIPVSHDHE